MSGYRCSTLLVHLHLTIEIFMKRVWIILSLTILMSGCGNESGFNEQDLRIPSGFVRVVHAMPDGPRLVTQIQAQRLASLNFGESTPYQSTIPEVERKLEISFFNGSDETIVATQTINVPNGHLFTIIIAGTMATPEIITFTNEQPASTDDISIQIFNGSVGTSASYDFFLTRGNESLTMPTTQLSSLQLSENYSVAAGSNYRLQFSGTGNSEIIWNSGLFEIDEASSNPLFLLLDNFGASSEAVNLIGYDNQKIVFPEDSTISAIRVAHMMADTDPLDIYVEGVLVGENISFQQIGSIKEVTPGNKTLSATITGNPKDIILQETLDISPGNFHTVALINNIEEPLAVINTDSFRRIPQAITLTISNYSTIVPDISIFVLESGQDPSDSFPLTQQGFGQTTINILPENNYELLVYNRLTNTLVAGPLTLAAAGNTLYKIYITDQTDSGQSIDLLLGDDLDPPFEPRSANTE